MYNGKMPPRFNAPGLDPRKYLLGPLVGTSSMSAQLVMFSCRTINILFRYTTPHYKRTLGTPAFELDIGLRDTQSTISILKAPICLFLNTFMPDAYIRIFCFSFCNEEEGSGMSGREPVHSSYVKIWYSWVSILLTTPTASLRTAQIQDYLTLIPSSSSPRTSSALGMPVQTARC